MRSHDLIVSCGGSMRVRPGPVLSANTGDMKIRFALPVTATDGMFGDVGDIVIDPITRDITHIVVEPHHRHCRARLVPIDVVTVDERGVSIALSTAQIRALPTVADGDFVRFGEPIDLGDDWDVGIEHVVSMPYSARTRRMMAPSAAESLSWKSTSSSTRCRHSPARAPRGR